MVYGTVFDPTVAHKTDVLPSIRTMFELLIIVFSRAALSLWSKYSGDNTANCYC